MNDDQAKPIDDLITYFESNGSSGAHAYAQDDHSFTAQQWQQFSAKEKDDILMSFRWPIEKQVLLIGVKNWAQYWQMMK